MSHARGYLTGKCVDFINKVSAMSSFYLLLLPLLLVVVVVIVVVVVVVVDTTHTVIHILQRKINWNQCGNQIQVRKAKKMSPFS